MYYSLTFNPNVDQTVGLLLCGISALFMAVRKCTVSKRACGSTYRINYAYCTKYFILNLNAQGVLPYLFPFKANKIKIEHIPWTELQQIVALHTQLL